ncbi:MAG: FAD-binding oxidoreductase [Chloroflexota bacterium]
MSDGQVRDRDLDLLAYSYDSSFLTQTHDYRPQAVVVARSAEDVARTVRFAHENGVPVVPRGAGTGQTGGAVAASGGIVLDVSALNQVLELDKDNLQVFCEPGVVHADLNAYLSKHRLFFPPDPGSTKMCTLGGMVANNSRGMRAIKYGSTGDYVLGLDVVLPSGEVITTGSLGSRAIQSSSGLDLTRLFVGSEGTLGVFTRLRLKVLPLPASRGLVLAAFDHLEDSGRAVMQIFAAGLLPSAIEILDSSAIKAVNLYKPALQLPEAEAVLLFELDGNKAGVAQDAESVAAILRQLTPRVQWADEPRQVAALWEGRSVVGAASGQVRPGATRVYAGEDICVPISRVPEALRGIQEIGAKHETIIVTYGHIASGNLHAAPVIDMASAEEKRRVELVADEIHEMALRLGGTVTGEHGVGLTRRAYMEREHGAALAIMQLIKQALDPKGIMNPGKALPA